MPQFDQELLEGFIQESREHLDTLETDLVALERERDNPDIINRIFRAVHTIKGGAGFLGLEKIGKLSHIMENIMSLVREGSFSITKNMTDAFLASTDKLRAMIDDPEHSQDMDIAEELAALEANFAEQGQAPEVASTPTLAQSPEESSLNPSEILKRVDNYFLRDALKTGRSIYLVRLNAKKDIEAKKKTPLDVFKEIETFGEFLDCFTDISEIEGFDNALAVELIYVFVISSLLDPDSMPGAMEIPAEQVEFISPEAVENVLKEKQSQPSSPPAVEPPVSTMPEPPPTPPAAPEPEPESALEPVSASVVEPEPAPAVPEIRVQTNEPPAVVSPPSSPTVKAEEPAALTAKQSSATKTDETIRVSVSLLDDLMNLAGEMVLGRNQLMRLAEGVSKKISGMPAVLQNINIVTSDMQEKVMRTRLQPIGTIFGKFNRIIRDLSRKLNKEIDLMISGEDVELDKSIIEALVDPLTHLIRNCADHGIETPAERERAGKRQVGTVQLTASHVGGQVLIEIIDDGKGVDPEKMKRKALEKGLIKPEEAERMTDRQAANLIFLPGFSTAEAVSDLSGRGVGMDVVKTNIEGVGGSVDLDSQFGRGTRISLRLPLTLAIIPAMVVGMKTIDRRFAVPQVSLEEIVHLDENHHIEDVRGVPVLRLRDKLLPLVSLADLLNEQPSLHPDAVPPPSEILESSEQTPTGEPNEETVSTNEPHPQTEEPAKTPGYILVLKVENDRYGLIVEELFDSEEIVVKPLSSYLKNTQCYSGATIMGDGKVAMILDPSGIAALADLKFDDIKKEGIVQAVQSSGDEYQGESQSLLLFRNEDTELFAVNLAMIARIEKIKFTDIEHLREKEYLKYRDSSLRLLRLHDYMPVAKPAQEFDILYVIVPKLVSHPMGIIATKIVDVVRSSVSLDQDTVEGMGILGSAVINEELAVFIDVYGLFEEADPEHYRHEHRAVNLAGKRILLAEDTAFFRAVELQYLRELSCHVDVAVNGIEAFEKLNHQSYDLLLTDIEMPGMDGFELVQRVRASDKLKNLPIIALSALSADQYKQRGDEVGVDAYEVKLDKERLRGTLERVLAQGHQVRRVETDMVHV